MARRRRKWVAGLIPRLIKAVVAGMRWIIGHPQPLIALAIPCVALWALWTCAHRAEAFRISHVRLPADTSLELPSPLLGRNLWDVDLRQLAAALKAQQPALKTVRVVRELPNAIRIDAIRRTPIAQVRLTRWHAVDEEGFILPGSTPEPHQDLVRFVGLRRKPGQLVPGRLSRQAALLRAVRALSILKDNRALSGRKLTELNAGDPRQIRFTLDDQTEVRCGAPEEIEAQLGRLKVALDVLAKEHTTVKYIDIRFEEPVIGPRI